MGSDGKLAEKKAFPHGHRAVMDNLAASTHSSYFRRSHQVALKAVFYFRVTRAWLNFGACIITCYYCCPLITTSHHNDCLHQRWWGEGVKYESHRWGPAILGTNWSCKSSLEISCSWVQCLEFSFLSHFSIRCWWCTVNSHSKWCHLYIWHRCAAIEILRSHWWIYYKHIYIYICILSRHMMRKAGF